MSKSPWFDAVFDPALLLLLGASVAAGLLAAWWLFPAGLVLWLVLFIRILSNPSLRLNQALQTRKDISQRFQSPFDHIQHSQVMIFNSIGSARGSKGAFQPVQAAVDRLIDQVYELCQRYTPMENYRMVTSSQGNPDQDLAAAKAQIESAKDPATKQAYEESAKDVQQRLEKYQAVCDQLNRFDAQLSGLVSALDGTLTDIVQAQTLDSKTAKVKIQEITQKLNQEVDQLKNLA